MNNLITKLNDMQWPKVLLISLLLGAGYYLALYEDGSTLNASLEDTRQALLEAEKQLDATKQAVKNADKFETEVKTVAQQFERISDFMPERMSIAELTSAVTEKAIQSGAQVMKTAPKPEAGQSTEPSADFFEPIALSFELEGSFSQIVTFLSLISRETRLVNFDNVSLEARDVKTPDAPKLSFTGDLIGYRYIKRKPVVPGNPEANGGESANL